MEPIRTRELIGGWPPEGTIDLALSNVAGLTYGELGRLGSAGLPEEFNLGDPAVRISPALQGLVAARHGLLGKPERVLLTNGASEANFLLFAGLLGGGPGGYRHVIVEDPTYPPLANLPLGFGVEPTTWRRKPEADFTADIEALAGLLDNEPEPSLVVMSNLHNPSGAATGQTTMKSIAELVGRAGGLLVVDEIYRELEPGLPSVATLGDHCVSVGSLSKVYGSSTLRIGWIIGELRLLEPLRRLKEYVSAVNSAPCELLAYQQLSVGDRLVQRAQAIKAANAPLVEAFCRDRPELTWHTTGGLIAFVGVDHPLGSLGLATRLREQFKVLVSAGEHFGWPGFLRLGFGCHPEELPGRLEAFGSALDVLS